MIKSIIFLGNEKWHAFIRHNIDTFISNNKPLLIIGEPGVGKSEFVELLYSNLPEKNEILRIDCRALENENLADAMRAGVISFLKIAKEVNAGNVPAIVIVFENIDQVSPKDWQAFRTSVEDYIKAAQKELYGKAESEKIRIIATMNTGNDALAKIKPEEAVLFFNKNVFEILPLRERQEEIPIIIKQLFEQYSKTFRIAIPKIPQETFDACKEYYWNGNLKELKAIIEYLIFKVGEKVIYPSMLPFYTEEEITFVTLTPKTTLEEVVSLIRKGKMVSFDKIVADVEVILLKAALVVTLGNHARAARKLNLKRTTFLAKLKKYNLKWHSEYEDTEEPKDIW